MKRILIIIGSVLVVLGVGGFLFSGVSVSEKEEVLSVGELEVTHEEEHSLAVPNWVSAVLVGSGAIVLGAGALMKASATD